MLLVRIGDIFGERICTAIFGVDKRSEKRNLGGFWRFNLIGSGAGETLNVGGVENLSKPVKKLDYIYFSIIVLSHDLQYFLRFAILYVDYWLMFIFKVITACDSNKNFL